MSSLSCEWPTPDAFFRVIEAEFGAFDLDACATKDNAKATRFNDSADLLSGLAVPWTGRVWCNPPYGRTIGKWVEKAYESCRQDATLVVMLIPSRTDTSWWHEYVMKASEIRFVRGRLKFGGAKNDAPFASTVAIFRGVREGNYPLTASAALTA
jgi:phage N-6-adenine-methyltransferase